MGQEGPIFSLLGMPYTSSEAVELSKTESPRVPPDSMPVRGHAAAKVPATPILGPQERHDRLCVDQAPLKQFSLEDRRGGGLGLPLGDKGEDSETPRGLSVRPAGSPLKQFTALPKELACDLLGSCALVFNHFGSPATEALDVAEGGQLGDSVGDRTRERGTE